MGAVSRRSIQIPSVLLVGTKAVVTQVSGYGVYRDLRNFYRNFRLADHPSRTGARGTVGGIGADPSG